MPTSSAAQHHQSDEWPGRRLGLPEAGPRSVGRLGRRFAALAIDFAIAILISVVFFNYHQWAATIIFAVTQIVFLILLSGGIGHIVVGLRVVPMSGGWIGLWRPIVRTLLLCLTIPALIWDADQRGLHDKIAGTVLVRV